MNFTRQFQTSPYDMNNLLNHVDSLVILKKLLDHGKKILKVSTNGAELRKSVNNHLRNLVKDKLADFPSNTVKATTDYLTVEMCMYNPVSDASISYEERNRKVLLLAEHLKNRIRIMPAAFGTIAPNFRDYNYICYIKIFLNNIDIDLMLREMDSLVRMIKEELSFILTNKEVRTVLVGDISGMNKSEIFEYIKSALKRGCFVSKTILTELKRVLDKTQFNAIMQEVILNDVKEKGTRS